MAGTRVGEQRRSYVRQARCHFGRVRFPLRRRWFMRWRWRLRCCCVCFAFRVTRMYFWPSGDDSDVQMCASMLMLVSARQLSMELYKLLLQRRDVMSVSVRARASDRAFALALRVLRVLRASLDSFVLGAI